MQNKFFGSKLNTVLLLILIILMVFAIRTMKQNKEMYLGVWQKPTEQTTGSNNQNEQEPIYDSSNWISSDFKGSPYAVNISYPKNYTFNCCGDTDDGTVHALYAEIVNEKPSHYIKVTEPSPAPDFYKKDLESGKIKKMDTFSSAHLGTSVLAFYEEKTEYSMAGHTSFEEYIFQIIDQQSKPKYYSVRFYTPEEFSKEFKSEFLNRLELWK